MDNSELLSKVKKSLGISGNFHDETIQFYIDEVISFLITAGVSEENISKGIVSRGVADLWNYGAGGGELSPYFLQRATQLILNESGE